MSKNSGTWQTCPRCEGTGKRTNAIVTSDAYFDILLNIPSITIYKDKDGSIKREPEPVCPVCNGKMIISMLNGKPPID